MVQISKLKRRTPRQAAACREPIDELLDPELFKGLCDPTRLKLLACLAKCGRPCSVGEIGECCAVDISVVSRHLSQLLRAGILESTKRGREVIYAVKFGELSSRLRAIADSIDSCCAGGKAGCCGTK